MKKEEKVNVEIDEQIVENDEQVSEDVINAVKTELDNEDVVKEEAIEDKLLAAEQKIAELQDKYLRQVAEFDNYRKRTIKEKAELILNGGEKTITSILPVLDDMERAIATMDKLEDVTAIKEGVELIFQKFIKILAEQGVKKIETKEANFDVDLHEAIAQIPAPCDEMKGKVVDCVKTGYTLNDKVIRHAQVAVGL